MTITLYRLTATTDTRSTTDKIEFNAAVPAERHGDAVNAYLFGFKRGPTFGLADNQGATQELGDLQSLGKVEEAYVLEGVITKRDANSGNNTILNRLRTWEDEEKTTANWPDGRFGIEDTGDHNNDLTPRRTGSTRTGLILEYIQYEVEFPKNRVGFTMKLRVSRGDEA